MHEDQLHKCLDSQMHIPLLMRKIKVVWFMDGHVFYCGAVEGTVYDSIHFYLALILLITATKHGCDNDLEMGHFLNIFSLHTSRLFLLVNLLRLICLWLCIYLSGLWHYDRQLHIQLCLINRNVQFTCWQCFEDNEWRYDLWKVPSVLIYNSQIKHQLYRKALMDWVMDLYLVFDNHIGWEIMLIRNMVDGPQQCLAF